MAVPLAVRGWSFAIEQSSVEVALPDIRSGGWEITGNRADIRPSVTADGDSASFDFAPTSRILTDRLALAQGGQSLELSNLQTDLSQATVTLDYGSTGAWAERIAINGNVQVDAEQVDHPRLLPQGWHFEGSVGGRLAELRIQGTLTSAAGLAADLDVQLNPGGTVAVTAKAVLEGPEDVRALAATFTDWPALLTVESGTARLSVDAWVRPQDGLEINGRAELEKVTGVLNRTAVSELSGEVRGGLEQGQLTAEFRNMTMAGINPGIPINDVRFTGDYSAPASSPLEGALGIQQARAAFLDGRLRIPPGNYELANGTGQIPVELQEISLGRLMEVYPAEGLSGSGKLQGRIPLEMTSSGEVRVSGGRVSAVDPGGRLQLPADRLQAMLGGNQAMDLVVQALQNFHYSVLNSTIDYDEQGKLTLGLRLEGRNPELRGGQPVVLNVNLEEDIPALLTSLQLSGRVNEAVTRRVREMLQESGKETAP
ncbi:MAG: YdbH domain-containing protein [Pseudomonadota bacterium]|nr:YdbH domain-containing protein [Pseudomonadota bacterium]